MPCLRLDIDNSIMCNSINLKVFQCKPGGLKELQKLGVFIAYNKKTPVRLK